MTTQELKNKIDSVLGNSLRCLLPAYWWKKLFHHVADKIDEVESKIDEINGVDIVDSEFKLSGLDVPQGSVASVATRKTMKLSECYVPTEEDNGISDEELIAKLTPIKGLELGDSIPQTPDNINYRYRIIGIQDNTAVQSGFLGIVSVGGTRIVYAGLTNVTSGALIEFILPSQLSQLNDYLSKNDVRILGPMPELVPEAVATLDEYFTIVDSNTDVYVKGLAWEKLAKEGGAQANITVDPASAFLLYYPTVTTNGVYTMHETYINHNREELSKIKADNSKKKAYNINLIPVVTGSSTGSSSIGNLQAADTYYFALDNSTAEGIFVAIAVQNYSVYRAVQPNRFMLGFKEDGTVEVKEMVAGDTLYLYCAEGTGYSLTAVEKAVNAENIIPIWNSCDPGFTPRPVIVRYKAKSSGSGAYISMSAIIAGVDTTGMLMTLIASQSPSKHVQFQYERTTGEFVSMTILGLDAELSLESENGLKNKVVTAELNKKVDKVEGKQLSTEDFTTALKTKLEELNTAVETITNTIIENEEVTAAALNELNERVVTPYEYYKGKGGVVSENAYNIMTKYLFTPFIISNNSTTTIPDELLNESQTSFFTDYYWNFMRLTGGEPIRTTQWANNAPQKFVGISSGLSFVIDFSNKTITPEQ